jgi:uncharacterized membrane protein YvbJ
MIKNCSLCGFANAENAVRCESCQSPLRPSPRHTEHQTAVSKKSVLGGNSLVVLIIVFVVVIFAIYKMFDNSSVAQTDAKTAEANVSNTALIDFSKEATEIESNQNAQKRVQQAEYYRQKRERRKAASQTPTDVFGSPEPNNCKSYINEDGYRVETGKCY